MLLEQGLERGLKQRFEQYLFSTYTMVTHPSAHTISLHRSDVVPVGVGDIMYKTSTKPRADTLAVKTQNSVQVNLEPQPYTVVGCGGFGNTVHVCKTSDPSQVYKYVSAHALVKASEVSPTNPKTVLDKLRFIDNAVVSADKTGSTKEVIESMSPMINHMKTNLNNWAKNPIATHIPKVEKMDQHLSKVVDLVASSSSNKVTVNKGGRRRKTYRSSTKRKSQY